MPGNSALGTALALAVLGGMPACGSDTGTRPGWGDAGSSKDAPMASEVGRFPAEATVSTCQDYASVTVGSYVVQSNYWNKRACPGTQCMDINKETGAFTVTRGPDPCGDTVATYPNVLYGCSFGNCSPASLLPMPMREVATVTSSWDFSVGGAASDHYDVAYDIWFCPDQSCGSNGFPRGVELMIWLDYKNTKGWKTDLGKVTLSGYGWEVWQAPMGSSSTGWTYMAYLLQGPAVDSVKELDLGAFFRDLATRGIIQDSWYLYAIQAGNELRTGGVPYDNNSFSVTINGVTPSTRPVAQTSGPSCDGGVPVAPGTLNVSDNYVTTGALHGYAAAWAWVGGDSSALACAMPTCSAPGSLGLSPILGNGVAPQTSAPVTCAPALAPSALCTSGVVTGDPSYSQVAGVGFNLNQDRVGRDASTGSANDASVSADLGVDGGMGLDGGASLVDGGTVPDGGVTGVLGSITIANSIAVSIAKTGSPAGNTVLRLQLTAADGTYYCYGGGLQSNVAIPVGQLNTKCWDNSGAFATPSTQFKRVDVLVPGSASSDAPFAFCLTGVSVQ
jgi:hypothetical protein